MMKLNAPDLDPKTAKIMPWLVAVAFFMQMLDSTILNTALPGIAQDLGVPTLRMQSVIIAYMLTTALFIPASGFLADRYGTRKIFVLAIVVFTLGSLLCAVSRDLNALIIARVVQGLGGALMVPVGRLSILKAYPREDLVRVLSFVTLPGLIGPLLGPVIGGGLVQYASWHWIFLINIPVGMVGALLSLRFLPDIKSVDRHTFDGVGFLYFSLSMVMLLFAMEGFGELQLPRVQSTLLGVSGLLLFSIYWIRAARARDPLFPPQLFKTRSFAVGIAGNLFARLGSGSLPFLLPLFLQLGLGFTPFRAGLTMMPTALAAIVGKQLINGLVQRWGFKLFLTANTTLLGLLIGAFALLDMDTPYGAMLLFLALFGMINSMQFTAMNSVTLIDLPDAEAGSGNSLLSVTMQIAATTGVTIGAALLNGFLGSGDGSVEHVIQAFHYTYMLVGLLTIGASFIFVHLSSSVGKAPEGGWQEEEMRDTAALP